MEVLRRDAPWLMGLLALAVLLPPLLAWNPWVAMAAFPALAGVAVLVLRPGLAVPTVLGAMLVSDSGIVNISFVVPITLAKLATIVVLGAWFIHTGMARRAPVGMNAAWPALIAMVVVIVLGLARVRAIGPSLNLVASVVMLSTLLQVVAAMPRPEDLRAMLTTMAVVVAVILPLSLVFGSEQTGNEYGRFVGFALNANLWAVYLLMVLGPTVAALENEESWWSGPVLVGVIGLTIVSLLMTISRSGILTLVLTSPFYVAILWRRKGLMLVGAVLAVAVTPLLVDLTEVWARFDSFVDAGELETDGSVRDRALAQLYALETFLAHPVLGIGTDAFVREVEIMSGGAIDRQTHNTYTQILAEQGLVGFAVFAWLGLTFVWLLVRSWVQQKSPRFRRYVLGFAASLVSFGLFIFTYNGLANGVAYLLLGVIVALERISRAPSEVLERARVA